MVVVCTSFGSVPEAGYYQSAHSAKNKATAYDNSDAGNRECTRFVRRSGVAIVLSVVVIGVRYVDARIYNAEF